MHSHLRLFFRCIFICGSIFGRGTRRFADDAAIKNFLHEKFDGKNAGMVIGLVDGHGSRIFGAGRLDNGTGQEVNGDTVFEIGSITKTFTALLLQDMVERGEMNLNDPVAKYLPQSVVMPRAMGRKSHC